MTARRAAMIAATILAGGAVATLALASSGRSGTAEGAAVVTSTAPVIRMTLASRQQVSGSLERAGAYTLVFQQPAGIVSWLPQPGSVITRGGVLYEVDGQPVRLLYGAQAAYRTLALGITDGADVRQLQRNLIALGDTAGGQLEASGRFDWATTVAIERWQRAVGAPQTGILTLGSVAFLPGPVHVDAQLVSPGTPPQPGTAVLTLSSTSLAVSVPLDPSLRQLVHVGDLVQIQLPQGQITSGRVSKIGAETVAPGGSPGAPGADAGGSTGQSGGGAAPQPGATPATGVPLTVTLNHPRQARGLDQVPVEVQITDAVRRNVLAVPVRSLLATAQGGYALEVEAGRSRTLIPVTPGVFDGGWVQVSSPHVRAGMRVEVPAT